MTQDTNIENLIINKLTKAQYESIANPDPAQLYFITDEVISSTDVTNALGYTPYNSSNPNGYTSNVGTVTSVNNIQPDANGNVVISTHNVGEIITSTLPLTDAGLHLLDGSLIQGGGIYQGFVDYIADLYTANPSANYFTTEALWQQSVNTYGVCGKFVYDSTNNTVRLPKVTGIIEGTTDLSALGDLVEAGLPNITGTYSNSGSKEISFTTATGAFTVISNTYLGNQSNTGNGSGIGFDASRSSSIYGNSSTVQPQTIKAFVYIVIANSTKTDIQVDIDQIATDLNGKANVDASNFNSTGTTYLSGLGMPSDRYINLTIGASGTIYTAPANGWVVFCVEGGANGLFGLNNGPRPGTERISTFIPAPAKEVTYRTFMPIMKNSEFSIEFYSSVTPQWLVFIYAQGSESEAN